MRVAEGERILSIVTADHSDEEETSHPEEPEEGASESDEAAQEE